MTDLALRLTCTVPEMATALGIGRDAAYAAVERGELPAIRVGRRLIVPVPRLLELVGALRTDEPAAESTTATGSTLPCPRQGEEDRDHQRTRIRAV